jgi:hypothetical protein
MQFGRQSRALWLAVVSCGIALTANVFRADAIIAYDDPGPIDMQVTTLVNTIKSTLESYCPSAISPPQCEELTQMRHLLEAGSVVRLREMRVRVQAIEAELQRKQSERNMGP